jgi:DNA-binding response OmpR family regulator
VAPTEEESRAAVKVLIVEDNPADARLVLEMLREAQTMQFEVESVSRLSAAIEHLRSRSPDILLLDLGLPDAAGLQGLQTLRAEAEAVPAIVLSGYRDDQLVARAAEVGAQDYLVKGRFDSEGLERAIRYAIQRKRTELELGVARNSLSHLLS